MKLSDSQKAVKVRDCLGGDKEMGVKAKSRGGRVRNTRPLAHVLEKYCFEEMELWWKIYIHHGGEESRRKANSLRGEKTRSWLP